MDNALSLAVPPVQPVQVARLDHYVRSDAVATELPSSKSVQSAWTSEPVDNQVSPQASVVSHAALAIKTTEQRYERDRETSTLVFKQIDPNSGEVIMQLPDQSVLNLRVYLKQQETSANSSVKKSA